MHAPRPFRPRFGAPLAALLASALLVSVAFSRPTIRTSFFNAYPGAVGSVLDNVPSHAGHCGVCHYSFDGGGPRNYYGVRLGEVIGNFSNNDAGRQAAMHSIENEDPDGDGYSVLTEVTNLTYVNTPTFPGLTPSNVGSVSAVDVNDILGHLVPQTGADLTPPTVALTAPNGGQSWTGGTSHAITWTATDNVAVTTVDLFFRDAENAAWTMLGRNLANTGTFTWFVHDLPTTSARVKVLARDAAGNLGADSSDAVFTIVATPGGIVPTTLRDFDQPGTQPFGGGSFETSGTCITCHGGYDPTIEPGHLFQGTMMGQAARDPLFFACVAVAEQDAPSSGDLCIRCHSPTGWLQGRSQPTGGGSLIAPDRDGVNCDFCHRLVDPVYQPGVSPAEDASVLGALLPGHTPSTYANGQYVVDPDTRKRGPFPDPVTPHAFLESPVHRSANLCGTCHDVSNPVFERVAGADYAPGPLDQKASAIHSGVLMPLERTFSEWQNSAYPAGVYAPEFAGNKPDGIVATCQDCHMADVSGRGCNDGAAPVRSNLPRHDLTGGNAWLGPVIGALYPGETDAGALADAAARATAILVKAALLDVTAAAEGDSFRAEVVVTNRTGHKLPTGYPEGRRMWLHVEALDDLGQTVYESGAYDAATGVLTRDPDAVVYEAHLGISPALAQALGLADGPSFHFTLNDSVYKDNRIPPLGYTYAGFDAFGGVPVDEQGPVPRYADGQNWDTSTFHVPAAAHRVRATLYYQTTSKEYVEFLKNENSTNSAGDLLYDAWTQNGRSAPVVMAMDSVDLSPTVSVGTSPEPTAMTLRPLRNPFGAELQLHLELARPAPVALEIFDAGGRRIAERNYGTLGAGAHRLGWEPREAVGGIPSGIYWARVRAGNEALSIRVVHQR